MNKVAKVIAAIIISAFILSGCTTQLSQRRQAQEQSQIQGTSLEKQNLEERRKRDEDANRVGYVYLINYGKPFGYYVIKGKVSSSGSQIGPEQELVCGSSCEVMDSAQDDGTYGSGDPGVFFFLSTGTKVETTLDYIYTDEPMAIDVPLLGGK